MIALNDNYKHSFICIVLMSWLGLCESDNIKQMITLTVTPLSGIHCIKLNLDVGCPIFGSYL